MMKKTIFAALILLAGFSVLAAEPETGSMTVIVREMPAGALADVELKARRLPDKATMSLYTQVGEVHRVIVKFKDDLFARADQKANRLLLTQGPVGNLQLLMDQYGISFEPLIKLPEEKLRDFEKRAARKSGRRQPDFAGIMAVVMPDRSAEKALEVAEALRALDLVEYVEIDTPENPPPPPSDYDPPSADLSANQDYRLPNPGIDIEYAWSNGYKGAGIRVSDCEYGFRTNHEDLVDSTITLETGISSSVSSDDLDHGTAVLGVLAATENAYGMTGLIPESDFHFYSEYPPSGYDRDTAVASAIVDSGSGDIVLLEMQFGGSPAEWLQTVWDLTKSGTDAGVIVIAAAGNGGSDLDDAFHAPYRARGDSGAIMVGAGSADTGHSRMAFSTYGTRVNLQGWGGQVATLGYGDLAEYGGDVNQRYTAGFNGTSSALSIVAGACAAVQNFVEQTRGVRLLPLEMRQLLVDTGVPQGSGGHIGPLPNVRAAMQAVESNELVRLLISTNTMTIAEGTTQSFDVKLEVQPENSVTVTVSRLSGSTQIQVGGGSNLVFTTNDWDVGQTVDIDAVDDSDFIDHQAFIRCDPGRFFHTDLFVTMVNGDQEVLVSTESMNIPEWEQRTFSVRLAAEVSTVTTVQVARTDGDTDIVVLSGSTLEYTPDNWNTWQRVVLTAAYDVDASSGTATVTCSSAGAVSGSVTVTEEDSPRIIFYEELLSTNPGWTVEGDWAFGVPTGQDGGYGADPTNGFSGTNVYGYNLNGSYSEIPTTEYLTMTSPIDCSSHTNVALSFYRWLGVERPLYDHASIDVSTNGADWVTVWTNYLEYSEETWSFKSVDISSVADAQSSVYIRWGMGITDDSYHFCGWNIDDIRLLGQSIAAADTDSDGLPDEWEEQHYGGATNAVATNLCANGVNTVLEAYIAGLNPTNAQSRFLLSSVFSPQSSVLSWDSVSGRVYSVWWTSNLLSSFQPLETNLPWTEMPYTDTNHPGEGQGFYKIEVELE